MKIPDIIFLSALALVAIVCATSGFWFGTVLFGGIAAGVVGFWALFKAQKPETIIAKNKEAGLDQSLYVKKYSGVDVNRFSSTFLIVGLTISLATTIMAFNWATEPPIVEDFGDLMVDEDIEQLPPQTEQKPPPPPPPPPPPELEVVEDEEVLEDEPEIMEQDVEEDTEIEIPDELPEVAEVVEEEPEPEEPEIFVVVEQMPQFPGGDQKMMEFIYGNIKYPPIAKDNGIEGLVVVSFVVDEKGGIKNIEVKRDIGGGCGEEAVRVVKKMPKWNPGKQRGKNVSVQYNLPVRFRLE